MSKVNSSFGFSIGVAFGVAALVMGVNAIAGDGADADMSDAAIAERIKPVGRLNTGAPFTPAAPASAPAESAAAESAPAEAAPAEVAPAASAPVAAAAPAAGPRSGQEVYKSACFVCHDMGIAGAPKLGDSAAWAPRIAQGMDTLVKHAIDGFQGATGVMPARGTCAACSDDELKAAVEYMVNSSK